jgi:hypothetical protein
VEALLLVLFQTVRKYNCGSQSPSILSPVKEINRGQARECLSTYFRAIRKLGTTGLSLFGELKEFFLSFLGFTIIERKMTKTQSTDSKLDGGRYP